MYLPRRRLHFRAPRLNLDETDGRSRYYLGLMMVPDRAAGHVPSGSGTGCCGAARRMRPWIDPILAQIEPLAQLAGVNYTVPTIGAGTAPGPSADDIEAAAEMTPEERMEMIGGMVDGLSNRSGHRRRTAAGLGAADHLAGCVGQPRTGAGGL